jgi:hypothetical protein
MKHLNHLKMFAALTLFALSAICTLASLSVASARPGSLSFEERVAYQRRIEEVYWRHRTATQAQGQESVPFEEAMPEASIREKVDDTLRKSAALDRYWKRPVTAAQLKAEVARMAAHTQQPGVLRELFAALDNNPTAIAECLARPTLVERQLRSWYAHDSRFHGGLRQQIESALKASGTGPLKSLTREYSERHFTKQPDNGRSKIGEGIRTTALSDQEWQSTMDQLAAAFVDGAGQFSG